jgi:hypothetical protein
MCKYKERPITMRRSALIGLFLAGALGIPAANADILYDINFSGSGTLPTAGSFTYDAGTSTFSGFLSHSTASIST